MNNAAFGTWDSPISAEMASSAIVAFQDLVTENEDVYWSEMRPLEGGRYAIVKYANGKMETVLPRDFNARTRVHEYGGAAFTVYQGVIYFVNFNDQRLYQFEVGQKPKAITAPGTRFANMQATPFGIVAVCESHVANQEPKNFLGLINVTTGQVTTLVQGDDFYASPAVSQDGKKIAWIAWHHPNMPWDDTELWGADFTKEGLTHPQRIDANTSAQAFFQPQWGPNNQLMVVSDKSNWWNLVQVANQATKPLFSVESEIGLPLWVFGQSTWGFFQDGIVCTFFFEGKNRLFFIKEGKREPIDLPYTSFSQIRTSQDKITLIASAPNKPSAILQIDKAFNFIEIKKNTALAIDGDFLSVPEHITFPSGKREAHAYFYAPKNKNVEGRVGTKPPLIVRSHGGPTANCGSNLNLDIQYWTSRGFAVVDVNYAGSTGYGRAYRKSLENNWGIFDVEDCQAAALYLADKGLVDKNKLAITGGSAGGYTTLAALTFTKTFQVGASHYGVSDLEALVKETHKFESRYLDRLIGPYPQELKRYHDRSPIYHVENLSSPVIFFQGDEDKIVPPNQAKILYDALILKGIKSKYVLFQGEQHGFRKAENRITALEAQRKFFMEVLGIYKTTTG